jgi:hypothetical protein
MEEPPRRSFITGEIDIKALIAFVFGAIFIITILVFATVVKTPSPAEIWTYRVILALAAAGVAAILPGFIDIKYKTAVQAGGALGIFVLVLLMFPAPEAAAPKAEATPPSDQVQDVVWPTEDPGFAARKYVDLVDNGKYLEAYEAVDKTMGVPWASFEASYKAGRSPLGAVVDRRQTGEQRTVDPPGRPKGGYVRVTYQTKFASESKCREEAVWLRAMPDKTWRMSTHDSSPQQVDCIGL